MKGLTGRIKSALPAPFRAAVQGTYFDLIDLAEGVLGRRGDLVPPRKMIYTVGGGEFTKIGREFLRHFIEIGRLEPHDRVLDVGCGAGRMAIPLTGFLSPEGEYWGFDIARDAIDWCDRNISRRFANFHFHYSDIYNGTYNPSGRYPASEYRFPHGDGYFDFVFLTSVFTHMLPEDLQNYLSELTRVLRPGGRCLITFFLLNQESMQLMAAGESQADFKHACDGYYLVDRDRPEGAVGYEEATVRELLAKHGLVVIEPVHYGSWCGRSRYRSYQDFLVATKAADDRE